MEGGHKAISSNIEERIVEMRFDNKQFESGAQESIKTLDNLKKSLDLTGAAKGFDNINSASNKINFSGLSNSVEAVRERFSALEVMAVTTLANITNSAVNAGKRMLSALTIAPVSDGFGEYELKMGSIQTMMMSTGESLETVNKYLDELNLYADKTIYSFSDMTSNIGKFTNAGVNLKDAVKAIQGVSNVAAISGANTNEASRAMYNFAQALSSGSVKLIDWKSIENANMATVDFKNELLATAIELGTVKKQGDKYVSTTTNINGKTSDAFNATQGFNDSLNSQWMTTEVLVKTLNRYSDETTEIGKKAFAAAQDVKTFTQLMDTLKEGVGSGWASTWEIVFGNFEEAKTLWTNVSNVVGGFIDAQSNARNELLKGWKDLGGREALITAFKNSFEGLKSVVIPVNEAFREFFPALKPETLVKFSNALKDLTAKFKMSDGTAANLKNTFRGLFASIDILRNLLGAVLRSIKPLLASTGTLAGKILSVTGSFGNWLAELSKIIKKNDIFYNGIQLTIRYIKLTIEKIKEFSDTVRKYLRLPELSDMNEQFSSFLGFLGGKLSRFSKDTLDGIDAFGKHISSALNKNIETKGLDDVNKKLDHTESFMSKVSRGLENIKNAIIRAFTAVRNYISSSPFFQFLAALWKFTVKVVTGIGKIVGKSLVNITAKLQNADFDTFLNLIKTLTAGGLALALSKFFGSLTGGISDIKDGFSGFKGVSKGVTSVLNGLGGCLESYQTKIKAGIIMKIAISVAILAAAVLAISLIDSKKLDVSLGAITVMFGELMGSLALFSKVSGNMDKGTKAAGIMMIMSLSVLILASACKKLAKLDPAALGASIAAITVLMYDLSVFANKLGDSKKIMSASIALIAIGISMKILASACKTLARLDWNELAKGLSGITILLFVLAEFTKKLSNSQKILKASIALIAIGTGMKILASACKTLGHLDWDELGKGIAGLTVLMYVLSDFTKKLSDNNKILKASIALIALGASMKIFASACRSLGKLEWDELGKGIGGLTVLLYVLADFTKKLSDNNKILKASIALNAISSALKILASVCKDLGQLNWEELGKGIGSLTVLMYVLSDFTKKLGSSGKIMSASMSLIFIGTGMKILASACKSLGELDFKALAKGLSGIMAILLEVALYAKMTANSKNIFAASTAMISMAIGMMIFASACKAFSKVGWKDIAKALVTFAGAFAVVGVAVAAFGPALGKSLALIGVGFLAIGAGLAFIGGGLALIGVGLTSISVGFTALATSAAVGATEVVGAIGIIISGIAGMIPTVARKIGEAIVGLIKYIGQCAGEIGNTVKEIVLMIATVLTECAPDLVDSIFRFIIVLLDALVQYAPDIVGKIMEFLILVLRTVAERLPELIGAAVEVLTAFFVGIFDAFNNMDSSVLMKALSGVGILAAILTALAALGALAVPAMAGVAAVGILVAELAGVMAALGALEQIPGINWIIGEGGELLSAVGGAIGGFVGSIVGSFMEGVATSLPSIGSSLSEFFQNAKPFLDGMATIDPSCFDGVKTLAEVVLIITASDILDGLTSWFTGGSSLADFGKELAEFGPSLSKYYESVKNVDDKVVEASANAALSLAAFANKLPKRDGVVQWFIGNTETLSDFAKELCDFGPAFAKYSKTVESVKPDIVKKTSDAATSIAEFAKKLPTHGGIVKEWFTGDTTLSKFAEELEDFGPSFADYSKSVEGVKPDVVKVTSDAAMSLAELASKLPSHGGVIKEWFTGDATLSDFADELEDFGPAIKKYSDSVAGFKPEAIVASANAAQSLSELSSGLPPHGGIIKEWFTGDADLSTFANELNNFGPAMKLYSESIDGIDANAVVASANAAKALAAAAQELPDRDGLLQKFTGEKSLSKFASELKDLGPSVKDFANNVTGIDSGSVTAAANAADILAQAESKLPQKNGVAQVITGTQSYTDFAKELKPLGTALKSYAEEVKGMTSEDVKGSTYALNMLVSANSKLSRTGGWVQNVIGEKDFGKFAEGLGGLGESLAGFASTVKGIKSEEVDPAANVISVLAEAVGDLDRTGGLWQKITGETDIADFASGLYSLAEGLVAYVNKTKELEDLGAADRVTNMAKLLAEIQEMLPRSGGYIQKITGSKDDLGDFADDLEDVGEAMSSFLTNIYNSYSAFKKPEYVDHFLDVIDRVLELGKGMMKIDSDMMEDFGESMAKTARDGLQSFFFVFTKEDKDTRATMNRRIKDFIDDFAEEMRTNLSNKIGSKSKSFGTEFVKDVLGVSDNEAYETASEIGEMIVGSVQGGMKSKENALVELTTHLYNCITANITDYEKFKQIGRDTIENFSVGIKEYQTDIKKIADDITAVWMIVPIRNSYNSFYSAGTYLIAGFVSGISENTFKAEAASRNMAKAAKVAAEKELDEHSPSKVGYQIGDYFGVAFVEAIESYQKRSYEAGKNVAGSAKSGLSDSVRKINDYIDGNVDIDITIRPVLDLTELRNGTSDLNRLLSANRSYNIASQSELAFNSSPYVGKELKTNNKDVVSEISALRNDVAALNSAINNMRVVMDTGALVGTIAAPINTALGRQAKYERRRN